MLKQTKPALVLAEKQSFQPEPAFPASIVGIEEIEAILAGSKNEYSLS